MFLYLGDIDVLCIRCIGKAYPIHRVTGFYDGRIEEEFVSDGFQILFFRVPHLKKIGSGVTAEGKGDSGRIAGLDIGDDYLGFGNIGSGGVVSFVQVELLLDFDD